MKLLLIGWPCPQPARLVTGLNRLSLFSNSFSGYLFHQDFLGIIKTHFLFDLGYRFLHSLTC